MASLEIHHRKAEKALQMLKDDVFGSQLPNSGTATMALDLQQVILIPTLTHSNMFYC